jgi:uncharacterized protein YndB with AHSA1/START domain
VIETTPLSITTPSEREIRITRSFAAPRHLVFAAYTRPDLLRRWLLGPPGWSLIVCDVDLRVGGAYRYVWRKEDGTEMGMGGTFREVSPPDRLVATELFDQDWTGGETVSTLELSERDGRTMLVNVVSYSSREARDGALQSGMEHGMEASYARLDEILAAAKEGRP